MAICLTPKNVDAQNKYENFGPHAAYAITWQNKTGNWYAVGPVQSIQVASKEEKKALAEVYNSGSATFLGECGKYRVYYLGVDYKSSDLDVLKYIRKYGYSCNWPTSSPPKLGEKNDQASNTSKIQSGENSKNKNEFYTMTFSSGNNQNTTNSTTKSNQDKSNTSVSNLYTTNNSSLKENNTAQEKSVASNINLKKNKSVEYSNKGNQFYNNGSYDEAEMYWEKALKLDPNNQAAKNNIAQLKNIQNSNAQIMAQSQQRANDFNAQQQNIQQSSKNIANNLADGSPNAVGQAGVATAKLLAESGAGYAESMIGGAGVVALGALLNGGGKTKSLGLTGENITKKYKNATYVGGFYDGKFDGNMKVTFKNGIRLERTSVRKPGGSDYETIIIVPNTCKGKVHCLFKNNRVKMNTPKNYLQALLIPLRNYKSELKYFNGDKYVGQFYHSNSHLFVGGEYSFANGKIVQINSLWADLAFKSAKVTFKNGNTIEGKFIEMIREGKSTYTWTDNDKYECKFNEGKRTGKLDLTFNNGDVFHTNYKDNTFSKGTYKQSNGEILSISIDRIIEEELNEIPQSNLFKILLIAYEDMLNTENNKKANKLYVKLLKYHDNDSKLLENELKSLLIERNPFLFISPSIENNIACLYHHLDKGYANLKYNDSISALKHYYCASKIIKCIGSDIFDSPHLRQLLYQVEIDCDSNYYNIALSADKVFQNTELFNLISYFDYKSFTKPIAKSNCKLAQLQTPFYWYWDKTGNVTYQEYSCYLNETVTKKDKIKRPHFTYYKGMILPQYNYASKIADLRYKDYVEYMEWLTNKTPTRQEYRSHYSL